MWYLIWIKEKVVGNYNFKDEENKNNWSLTRGGWDCNFQESIDMWGELSYIWNTGSNCDLTLSK